MTLGRAGELKPARSAFFLTRGVVLVPDDLSFRRWPDLAKQAGLTTVGLHHGVSPQRVASFIRSEAGQHFLARCQKLGLQVEYELHAMRELLPRGLFAKHPEFFRTNEKGDRVSDCNLCVHSGRALELAAENALTLARLLRPSTARFFYWTDDGRPWCRCPQCAGLSDSDQALVVENRLAGALRGEFPGAQLAHLAYSNTLTAPTQIKPEPGVFLEFAPIGRRYDIPLSQAEDANHRHHLAALDANLKVFGGANAQVLEYWLDVSRFSKYAKPAVKVPFREEVFAADLECYAARGLRHIRSFAVFIDAEYVRRYGEPTEVIRFGERLARWPLKPGAQALPLPEGEGQGEGEEHGQ